MSGVTSRRKAEELILTGRVQVNGETVRLLGTKANLENDIIMVDGVLLKPESAEKVYFLFNKPRGCVSTTDDPQGRPTVMDYFKGVNTRVYPVGRLDYASEGLMVFTNDGELANRLMHPSSGVVRTYAVKVKGSVTEAELERLRQGIRLSDGFIEPLSARRGRQLEAKEWIYLDLTEGKNLEVRRIFAVLGHEVVRLRRVAIGRVALAGLGVGKYRPLGRAEVDSLFHSTQSSRPKDAAPKRKPKRKIIPHSSRRGFDD